MDFRVLGPLEAGDGRESLALGPRKQRALLARLLLDAGRTVSVERLLDDLWAADVPDSAVKMVQIYVSGLRKAVGADRLRTRPGGYGVELGPDDVLDLRRFEALAAQGRAELADGDPAPAAAALRDALALWRGPALAEFAAEPFARGEGERLEELRLAALEDRIEADLALGEAPGLVGELEALTAQHPLRERPREQLMLALHRAGRQGEALAAYRAFRALLDTELGLEPSPRLRALEHAILTHDPRLDVRAPERARATEAAAPAGRARELEALRAALDASAAGGRRLVHVVGEPGMGKRTLVEAFLDGAGDALVIRGQCVEQRGAGEAYLPLLDGLGRAVGDERVAAALAARAPSWLAELPWLAATADRAPGATRERMLREIVHALEALAADRPIVLVVEDLQWADPSTRDVLAALLRRRHPARVLVVATSTGPDPLVADLRLRGTAEVLVLRPLDAAAAAVAFGLDPGAAAEVTRRGGGNPLFMRHLVEHAKATGSLAGVPETLRAALHARVAGREDLELLQAAAVEGVQFTTAGVSAALGRPVDAVAAGSLVEPRGAVEWPDGTRTTGYAFAHALVREVLVEMLPPARRAELHRRIGERLEAGFGAAAGPVQAIAEHYLEGGRPGPAVRFLRLAAGRCAARRAYREAIALLEQALEAAGELPAGALRLRQETELLSELGQAHVALSGWSSPEAASSLERARAAAEALGDEEPRASVALALATLYEVRGEPGQALETVDAAPGAAAGVEGAELLACAMFHQGAFTRALEQADRGASEADAAGGHYATFPSTVGDNATVACHDWAALTLWFLGRPGESMERARHALALSEEPARAYSAATARAQMAALHACRDEPEETLHWAQATVDAARERGYAYRIAMGRVLRGWATAAAGRPEGVHELIGGLRDSRETGARLEDPFYLGLLADAHLRVGTPEAGLEAADEALAIAARERVHYYDAELHRLRGELLRVAGRPDDAEAALREALSTARAQGARSLELRAALALARAGEDARALVAMAHEPMAAEDTADVRAAAALLADGAAAPRTPFERRRITVLAWELDGVGELAERVDPAQLAELVRTRHAAVRSAVAEEGGHVATEDESGGLVYFGYPRPLEDGPLRAARAALRLADTAATVVAGVPVRVCVGIDSGPAVVGPMGGTAVAMGQTPRAAWHLAAAAPAGGVVVSEAMRARCATAFAFEPYADGHRIVGEAGTRAHDGELAPFVGREEELGLLAGRWQQAADGLGQAVFLTGEPGIGKSRLVRELVARLEPGAAAVLEFACSEARVGSALHPFADHLRERLAEGASSVEALLAEAGVPAADGAPVVAALLGLPGAAHLEPGVLRRRTADVVIGYVLAHADRGPVVVVVEDLHWADPSSNELVEELLDAIAESRVLLVATTRGRPGEPRSHISQLALGPCTQEEAETLVRHAAELDAELARAVVERSDGVPLFLEELARAAAAGGSLLPATLADSLDARLDALAPAARVIAEVVALYGRDVAHDLLAAAADLPAHELDRGLDQLVGAELLRRRGRPPRARYAFRHALLGDGVRDALSAGARRALHARIARAIERVLPDLARAEPDTVAHHLEAAGEPGRALAYRLEAGNLAASRSADAEAIDQLTHALHDLDGFPDDEGRADLELDVRLGLGTALVARRGYASLDVADCYERARELCRRTGEDARLLPVLYGQWVNAFVRARHEQALALGHELRAEAERRDPGALIVAERTIGWPLVCLGRFAEAREHLDRIPALHRPGEERPLRFLYGQDPAAAGLLTGGWALWGCGEPEAAAARAREAIALAHETGHPLTVAYTVGGAALLAALCGDAPAAREHAQAAIAVTEEFRFPVWRAWCRYALGWAELADGAPARAAATLRAALTDARETGAALFEPFALTVLAEAEAAAGRAGEAERLLGAAEDAAARTGETFWQPQTRRAQDALLASRG